MISAKDLIVKPISGADASRIIKALHYSGKVVNNSQIHLGVFLNGKCGGAMQFGPSLDKRKIQGLVRGTLWNEFVELNRMAFADWLPRNGESRCIGYAMRWIRKTYPWIKWVVSFADGAQCGDGTIYRASGFLLTGIRVNTSLWSGPDGGVNDDATVKKNPQRPMVFSRTSLTDGRSKQQQQQAMKIVSRTTVPKGNHAASAGGGASMKPYKDAGFKPIPGFQLRYIFLLKPELKASLTVDSLPFSEISRLGAGMYLGKPKRAASETVDTPPDQGGKGGSIPTAALHSNG